MDRLKYYSPACGVGLTKKKLNKQIKELINIKI